MDKTNRALLYLMRCALQNTSPDPIADLDYEQLYKLSVSHSVVAMTAMALENGSLLTERNMSTELVRKWKDAKSKAIRKNVLLDAEREEIFRYFEKQGIWYLPLKGSVLKDMYPKMGMRQMADNDILFDEAFRKPLKVYMESRGYKTVDYDRGNHDVYEKPPVYNFEFHVSLFSEYAFPEWAEHYQNVKSQLQKDCENQFGYHFYDEDFYVYLLIHGYKHYVQGGTGIRFLADIFVFLREKQKNLDWDYIYRELQTLKISEFETQTRDLAGKLFGMENTSSLADEEQVLLTYLMGAGTYGTVENRVIRELKEIQQGDGPLTVWTKIKYTWRRMFPDREFMKLYSPFCRKHPWSMPFFWISRLIKATILRRKAIARELQALNSKSKDR